MTEPPINDQPGGADQTPDPTPDTTPGPSREASMRLGGGEGTSGAALMDPANQSLADALRITFTMLQVAMVVLAGLFVFSGFQTVREGERGISVLFGRAVSVNLDPGFHFAAPYPFGELVKVDTGNIAPELNRDFWPSVAAGREGDSIEFLPQRGQLDPERDGSLITADLNLAHAQWQAVYRRVSPVKYAQNIYTADEDALVRAALKRGVVRAIATTGIDELLRPQEGGTREIARRAQEIAQESLDAIDSGIRIEQFEMGRRTAPASLLRKFRAVLDARSEAQKAITEARSERAQRLNGAAGGAADALLWLISRYELAIETGDAGGAERVLERIDSILEGDAVSFEGMGEAREDAGLAASEGRVASGFVVEIIQNAKVDRLTAVQEARGELEHFRAKRGQFLANPGLMVARDWAGAWSEFQARDFVQTMVLPVGHSAELRLNEDPDIIKELDRAKKQREREDAARQRERELRESRFGTDRGIPIRSD